MNELSLFNYEGNEIRTLVIDGDAWFVAADVCAVLDVDSSQTRRLDEDEKGMCSIQTLGGSQEMVCVNEPGLYSLVLGSRKPEAKAFKRWVTHEVIPAIRKTGGYVANDDLFVDTYLPFADDQTKMLFRATLLMVKKQNEQLAALAPKAEYFDALVDRNLLTNFRDTSKELKVKERDFIAWLLDRGYIYRDQKDQLKPYAQHVPDLFEMKDWVRGDKAGVQTMITPKGRETFRLLLDGHKQERTLQLVK